MPRKTTKKEIILENKEIDLILSLLLRSLS